MKKRIKMTHEIISALLVVCVFVELTRSCPVQSPCKCTTETDGRTIIDCGKKDLYQVPTFNSSSVLYDELLLQGNRITSIGDDAFSGLRVRRIFLVDSPQSSDNVLGEISLNAFRGLENDLVELSIRGNTTLDVPFGTIRVLVSLESITLVDFHQARIETGDFSPFPNLRSLHYANILLQSIASDAFGGNSFLETLKIESSSLENLPVGVLQNIRNVTSLSLTGSRIASVARGVFAAMTSLVNLDLSDNTNNINLDPGCFSDLESHLQSLSLVGNKLNSVDVTNIGNLSSLQVLKLSSNIITSFPNNDFPNLRILQLDTNQITNLLTPSQFEQLEELHLTNNFISSVGESFFSKSPSLKKLYMTDQQSTSVLNISSFRGIENSLEYLDLSQKGVGSPDLAEPEIWASVKTLRALRALNLGDTGLTYIPDFVFEDAKNLQNISLSNNHISLLSQEMFHGLKDTLRLVDLDSNSIRTVDGCVFEYFTNLERIHLNNNPFHCDCRMTWLSEWYQEQDALNMDFHIYNPWECTTPPELAGESFLLLSNLACDANVTQPTCRNYYVTLELYVLSISENFLKLKWNISDNSDISYYVMTYSRLPAGAEHSISNIPNVETEYELGKLENIQGGTSYRVCLRPTMLNFPQNYLLESCLVANTTVLPTFDASLSTFPLDVNMNWTITPATYVLDFFLYYTEESIGIREDVTDISTHSYALPSLKPSTAYSICVGANMDPIVEAIYPILCVRLLTSGYNVSFDSRIASRSDSYIKIQWDAADITHVSGFSVVYQTNNIEERRLNISRNLRELTINPMDQGVAYNICITAEITGGVQGYSPEMCMTSALVILPTLTIDVLSKDVDNFLVQFNVSNPEYFSSFSMQYENIETEIIITVPNLEQGRVLSLPHLNPTTSYELCVIGDLLPGIDILKPRECMNVRTVTPITTTLVPPGGSSDTLEGWIIGAAVAGGIFLILIILILCFICCYRKRANKFKDVPDVRYTVEARSFQSTGTPRLGYDSKRYARKKVIAADGSEMVVTVVSSGKLDGSSKGDKPDNPRTSAMSAGSYQYLSKDKVMNKPTNKDQAYLEPVQSTSDNVYLEPVPSTSGGHDPRHSTYVNSLGSRLLPPEPKQNGKASDSQKRGLGFTDLHAKPGSPATTYVNAYDEIPDTAKQGVENQGFMDPV